MASVGKPRLIGSLFLFVLFVYHFVRTIACERYVSVSFSLESGPFPDRQPSVTLFVSHGRRLLTADAAAAGAGDDEHSRAREEVGRRVIVISPRRRNWPPGLNKKESSWKSQRDPHFCVTRLSTGRQDQSTARRRRHGSRRCCCRSGLAAATTSHPPGQETPAVPRWQWRRRRRRCRRRCLSASQAAGSRCRAALVN